MAEPVVALVLVSHSSLLSQGVAEVAGQMAPDVAILAAGGTGDGRIGTGFDLIEAAIERALEGGRSAVVLTDLGSAALSAESVLEMAAPGDAARVRIVDAPFVEGAVEAAVVAQTGADLRTVVEAAEDAATTFERSAEVMTAGADSSREVRAALAGSDSSGEVRASSEAGPREGSGGASRDDAGDEQAPTGVGATPGAASGADAAEVGARAHADDPTVGGSRAGAGELRPAPAAGPSGHDERSGRASSAPGARGTAVLRNRLGLHARPAAQLVRTVSAFDALVTVNGVDARSVLALVGLGATGGQEVVVAATGPQARHAVNAVVDELENGFGEA